MRFFKPLFLLLLLVSVRIYPVIPMYFGARSLSLGYASSAYNYDFNSVFLNPGLLSGFGYFLAGYQIQNENSSYKEFGDTLAEVLKYDLADFGSMGSVDKQLLHRELKKLFDSKHGMYGFSSSIAGSAFKRYGAAVSFIKTAIVNPERTDILDNSTDSINGSDLSELKLNFTGLSYTQYSLSYSIDLSKEISAGVTVHYLSGKITEFSLPLMNGRFSASDSEKDYLEFGWGEAEEDFGKFTVDFALSVSVGSMFKAGVIIKNYRSPVIEYGSSGIELDQRNIISVSFRPDHKTGIYFDMDLKRSDLYFNGEKVQPVSIGLERSFFNGHFLFRAGLLTDLSEKYLFGSNGRIMYGLGAGIYINRILVDAGLGIGGDGRVRSFAVSGFFIVR